MRSRRLLLAFSALLLVSSSAASAQTTTQADDIWRAGARVNVVAAGHHDVWAAGAIVSVRGDVTNDLWVAGAEIDIDATARHDVMVAGAIASVRGAVARDLLVAGARVSVDSRVAGTLSVVGARVLVRERTEVQGESKIAGADVVFSGVTRARTEIYADAVQVDGKIGGDLLLRARTITIGKNAVIDGNVTFETIGEPVIEPGATIRGRQTVTLPKPQPEQSSKTTVRGIIGGALFAVGTGLVLGLVLLIVGRGFVERAIDQMRRAPLSGALIGLALVILLPVLAVLVMVTIVGIPVGLLTLLAFPLLLMTASVVTAFGLADSVFNRAGTARSFGARLLLLIVGLVIIAVLGAIPIVGFLTWLLAVIFGLGAIWRAARVKGVVPAEV